MNFRQISNQNLQFLRIDYINFVMRIPGHETLCIYEFLKGSVLFGSVLCELVTRDGNENNSEFPRIG
jgi:hypothetical protein